MRINNNKCKCLVYVHELMPISHEPMEIEEIETVYDPSQSVTENTREIIQEILKLIRTDHMNPEEKAKIINLISQYLQIIKRE